ncbi:MAG: DNA repair protein RadA [Acidimicrobiales bacterium]
MAAATRTTRANTKTRYACLECGTVTPKWAGRCDGCGEWNTVVEEPVPTDAVVSLAPTSPARPITEVSSLDADPVPTGIAEFDRVLGGGLVPGSVTLVGGEPGVGKSTLLLQVLAQPARSGATVLYLSAEESTQQVRRRAERLGALSDHLYLAAETNLAHVLGHIDELAPSVVVIDSIQTVFDPDLTSAPGSVGQVRQCAHRLVTLAKSRNIAIILVGHVTKEGALAGPRVLEHVVDTVLSFEGDRHHSLRLVRATKHRFGSTQELGLFAMGESGLEAVADPSEMFLADRRAGVAGSVIVPTIEGHRPLVVELQALVAKTSAANPRRSVSGVDPGRVGLLLAVIERRVNLPVGGLDTYAMAVGGARVTEPGADLGLALAIVSSVTSVAVPADVVVCGEVGLGGELRSVGGIERGSRSRPRLGFARAVVPRSTPEVSVPMQVLRVPTIDAAIGLLGLRD